MPHIPIEILKQCLADNFYKKCCLCSAKNVQFHENLIFAGQQVKEKFCILPLCKTHHDQANNRLVRERLDWIMCSRATEEDLLKYSKIENLLAKKKYLNGLYREGRSTSRP